MTAETNIAVGRTLLATLAAAVVLLVLAVLPAEYGIDPTGVGETLGLTEMAADPAPSAFTEFPSAPVREVSRRWTLDPFEAIEFKLEMPEGGGMLFDWRADQPVDFDFHAEGPHMPEGVAETFHADRAAEDGGTYVARFDGEHGWYWENRSAEPVTITLNVAGHVEGAVLYRSDRRIEENVTAS